MNQFKDCFLGKEKRAYTRAVSSQKCVRAGGKHNDLENVGFTARHHTFFEMLGNFSFGDYFKKEAIKYAWEFVTQELKLPKDRLYVTVFETDDEAAEIWHKQEGVPKDRIYRFGEKDNFWSMGDTGPCGPCSEIFIDRGAQYSCQKPTCAMGCDCDRYMEFWNLVFMQYERSADGKLNPLPKPSVDTGAGLERIASILQESETNYDTDGFADIIAKIQALSGQTYSGELKASFRVIADHSRATAFLIADGVMPSNEGRGYVLRRIMRRAIRHGKKLGFTGPFLHKTTGFVIDQMKAAYPDLAEKRAFLERAVLAEEEQFFKTLERGLLLLDEEAAKLPSGNKLFSGESAFKLYDTYGFPLDLTRVICQEKGLTIDEAGFERAMDRQRSESRKHWKGSGQGTVDKVYFDLAAELKQAGTLPEFTGYEKQHDIGKCVAILAQSETDLKKITTYQTPSLAASADSQEKGQIIEAVFNKTPFYGESGGQVGDRGRIKTAHGFEAEVIDVQRPTPDLIVCHLRPIKGVLNTGDTCDQETDKELRALTARNHTATHLLHWALREVLGKHVKQAGSMVSADLLRFDFSHFQALSAEELAQVEALVNERVWAGAPVKKQVLAKEKAIEAGAIAFFGEKYGDSVRVISVGDFSVELCGGTHVDQASDIHLVKITSETGIAAGVRRLTALTSKGAFVFFNERSLEIDRLRDRLKASSVEDISAKLEKMTAHEKDLKRQLEQWQSKAAGSEVDTLLAASKLIGGTRLICGECQPDAQGLKKLRDLCDRLKQKAPDAVVVLSMIEPDSGKVSLVVGVGPSSPKKWDSGALIRQAAALIDGKGGGKPDFAQAGGTNAKGLGAAFKKIEEQLGQ